MAEVVKFDFDWKPTMRDRLVARAQHIANTAVKRGLLAEVETLKCTDCGEPASCYDHRNYYHPLAVDAVCKGCNNRRGPGFPLPTVLDGGQYKTARTDDRPSWTKNVEGGEGYTPDVAIVHCELNWAQIEEQQDNAGEHAANVSADKAARRLRRSSDMFFSTGEKKTTKHFAKGQRLVLGIPGTLRYDYFKAHDPWGPG